MSSKPTAPEEGHVFVVTPGNYGGYSVIVKLGKGGAPLNKTFIAEVNQLFHGTKTHFILDRVPFTLNDKRFIAAHFSSFAEASQCLGQLKGHGRPVREIDVKTKAEGEAYDAAQAQETGEHKTDDTKPTHPRLKDNHGKSGGGKGGR